MVHAALQLVSSLLLLALWCYSEMNCNVCPPPLLRQHPLLCEQGYGNHIVWCSSALGRLSVAAFPSACWGAAGWLLGSHLPHFPDCGGSMLYGVFVFVFFRLCSSDIKYSANWSNETVFSSILISPKMITDHMPDVVLNALNSLSQEHRSCISCQTK